MCGNVQIGGDAPITVQSMTNTFTKDVDATVGQILALEEAGCEIVRVAVADMEDADAIKVIKIAGISPVHKPILKANFISPPILSFVIAAGIKNTKNMATAPIVQLRIYCGVIRPLSVKNSTQSIVSLVISIIKFMLLYIFISFISV
jgi:4-hydroxy-3-methylbut-2-en-1-yl diphosphate synthase IspG/GcpE